MCTCIHTHIHVHIIYIYMCTRYGTCIVHVCTKKMFIINLQIKFLIRHVCMVATICIPSMVQYIVLHTCITFDVHCTMVCIPSLILDYSSWFIWSSKFETALDFSDRSFHSKSYAWSFKLSMRSRT